MLSSDPTLPRSPDTRDVLEQAFDEAPAFMCLTEGPQHVFTRMNRNYASLIGTPPKAVGKKVEDVLPEVRSQGFIELLDRVYATGEPYFGREVPVKLGSAAGDSRLVYLDFAYQPIRRADGAVNGIFISGYDVTEKVRFRLDLENERENFRNLFRQTPEMVCILRGPDHVFEFVNEAHIRALGFDATGKSVREAQPESVEVHGILDDVYRTGNTAELNEIPVTVTDRLRYFNLTYAARRDRDGVVNGIMILGVEVTDQVLARKFREENEQRLRDSEQELENAVRTRDEFISIASHELKTPVTALKLQTQLHTRRLQKGDPPSSETLARSLEIQVRQLDKLTQLIEDMLDVSRIATGRLSLSPERCDLSAIAREVFERYGDPFRAAGVEASLNASPGVHVLADAFRLEQVLTNLLSNGMKYGEGRPIEAAVGVRDAFAELRVTDHGIGISPEVQTVIFDRFERGHASRNTGGLGLGLYITRQIVEAHGGLIDVTSVPGQGSTFSVRLPLAADG